MFTLSKLLWNLLVPQTLMAVLAATGAITALLGRKRIAALSLGSACLLGVLLTVNPLARLALLAIEQRFPARASVDGEVEGIIVLGGVMSRSDMSDRIAMLPPPRIATFIRLAQNHPNARLLFSGGSGELDGGGASEALWVRRWLAHAGIEEHRLLLDTASRTTAENAHLSRELAKHPTGRWILITSALHMPRAVGTFRAHGWDVVAWPVDHLTSPSSTWAGPWFSSDAEVLMGMAWKEALGLAAYRLSGRSNELLPAPVEEPAPSTPAPPSEKPAPDVAVHAPAI